MAFFFWSTAAILNVILAIIVLCVIISGASAYRALGSGWMAKRAERGNKAPTIIISIVMSAFLIFAVYCVAEAVERPLPYSRVVLGLLTVIYLLRASVLIFDKYIEPPLPTFALMASWGALAIGSVQAIALLLSSF